MRSPPGEPDWAQRRTGCQVITDPIVVAVEPLSSAKPSGELRAAAAGDVDRRERLGFVGGNEGRDLAPIGGEDRVGRGVVGDLAQLVGAAGADLLHPEPLVAAEEQHLCRRRDVFDEGRTGAGHQHLHVGAAGAHREDVGVGAGTFAALTAAEDDPALEVAGRELVDVAGLAQARQAGAGRAHRVDVVGKSAAGLGDAADEDDRLAVGRERRFVLVVGAGNERAGGAAEIDSVEVAQTAFGRGAGEDDVVAFGVELRPAVDLGPGGQLVLAGAVGPHRPDVAAADEGDLAPVGGEIRFAVGRVFGELVEVAFLAA